MRPGSAVKHLLLVAYTFPPAAQSGSMRMLRLVRHLGSFGWKVTVLTADPDHYFLKDDDLTRKIPPTVQVVRVPDPLPVRRLALAGVPSSGSSKAAASSLQAKRFTTPSDAARSILRKIKRAVFTPDEQILWTLVARREAFRQHYHHRFSAVLVSSPYHSTQLIGSALASAGVPYIGDYRDHWTLYPLCSDRFAFTRYLEKKMERRCLRAASAVVYTSDTTREEYIAAYPDLALAGKTHVVWNSYDEEDFDRSISPSPDQFLLVHAGNLYYARDPNPFLSGVRGFLEARPDARSVLRVEFLGVSENSFADSIRSSGLDEVVHFRGFLTHSAVMSRLCESSGLVLITGLPAGRDPFIPGKVFEYLGAGRPILALVDPHTPTGRLLMDRPAASARLAGVDDFRSIAGMLTALYDQWKKQPSSIAVPPDGSTRAESMTARFAGILDRI